MVGALLPAGNGESRCNCEFGFAALRIAKVESDSNSGLGCFGVCVWCVFFALVVKGQCVSVYTELPP